MAGPKLSEAVKAVLDATRAVEGEVEFSKEDALTIFGGAKAVKLSELTDVQLLQYCLMSAHGSIRSLTEAISQGVQEPNRATRRALAKKLG